MTSPMPAPPPVPEDHRGRLAHLLEDPLATSALRREERLAWGMTAVALLAVQSELEASLHRECGVTPFEYHLMMVLLGEGGDPEAGELAMSAAATRVDASLSRLSHVVRRLEARGWLARRPSSADARVTLVRLTPEGVQRAARCSDSYTRLVRDTWARHLDDTDIRDATRISGKLLAALREDHWLLGLAPATDGSAPPAPHADS